MDKQLIKQEAFSFLSAALLLAIAMETVWPRIIVAYFNLNWLLVIWLVSGVWLLSRK